MLRECKYHGWTDYRVRKDHNSHSWRCKKCTVEATSRRRRKIRRKLIALHGGSCIRCGYNKYIRALSFHHRDPTQKEFGLCLTQVVGWDRVVKEAEKCDLLCANCHMETETEKQRALSSM